MSESITAESEVTTCPSLTDPPSNLQRQEELEGEGMADGAARFRRRMEDARKRGTESSVGAARKLLAEGLEKVSKATEAFLEETRVRKGRRHYAFRWLEKLGADVTAYMGLKVVLDSVTQQVTYRRVCLNIAEVIVDELRYRRFKEEAPGLFQYKLTKFQTNNYAHMARSMDAALTYAQVDTSTLELNPEDRIKLGAKVLELVEASTGLITSELVRVEGNKTERFVVATPETLEFLSLRNGALESLWPVNLPMVVAPLPWGPGKRGGYRFGLRGKHPLVRGISKAHAEAVKGAYMPSVYTALNRIQETPWRINPHVLSLIEGILENGGGLVGLPKTEPIPAPSKPLDIDHNEEARKQWRKDAAKVHEENHMRTMELLRVQRAINVARKMKDEPAVWFPHNLDFRGRVYPVTSYLHPQGDDMVKGLLTFAQGRPLGEDGVAYLALHGANCIDRTPDGQKTSKMTHQERVNWVVEHTHDIVAVAEDPFADMWWVTAAKDDPFQFYAFCVEWAGWYDLEKLGMGEHYVSSLPCAQDGSCNGLQHYSAMLRDAVGAEAVNVSVTERPQDIYQRVADTVLDRLERDAADEPLARVWLKSALVNRSLTKRPVMTFGYGSKVFGFRTQLMGALKDPKVWPGIKHHFDVVNEEGNEENILPAACGYMARCIWDALGTTVVAAKDCMSWLQQCARTIASEKAVSWTVPGTGFKVTQDYCTENEKRVETMLAGKLIFLKNRESTGTPDPVKQGNAVAPNVVHSLDAAALMLTVEQASTAGIEHFAMVHDSYGTLPADCALLAGITRQAFYGLYANTDVVQDLAAQFRQQMPEDAEFPAPPPKGTLDLALVQESAYFFS